MEAEDINIDLDGANVIGRSDSATVWAIELEDGTPAAAKVFDTRSGTDVADRFRREADALARLPHHPALVRLYGAGLDAERRPVVITERCSAGSLADWLSDNGPMGWVDATALVIEVAGALETAHRCGVLHRDVKPSNILCGESERWKLADFDVARVMDSPRTSTGQGFASVAHAPPEAFDGDPAEPSRDVYSLASTLFQALTGEPPFGDPRETSMMAVLSRLANEPVADLRPLGVPDPVCEVIEKALSKDPLLRHDSAAAFADALNGARSSCGAIEVAPVILGPNAHSTMWINTAPPPPPASTETPRARRRGIAVLVAVAAVAFGLAAAVGALVAPRPGDSTDSRNDEAVGSPVDDFVPDEANSPDGGDTDGGDVAPANAPGPAGNGPGNGERRGNGPGPGPGGNRPGPRPGGGGGAGGGAGN